MASRVLIAGGGVAALEAALALRRLAGDAMFVELLAPEPRFWYRPASVAEPFGLGAVRHFDLAELASAAGARFTPGALRGVDTARHVAHLSSSGSIEYDALLIACGAIPTEAIPGALTFRGPADSDRVARLLDDIAARRVSRIVFAVPWGVVWSLPLYELALMTAAQATKPDVADVELTLVTPEDEPLGVFGSAASAAVRRMLEERGVTLRTRTCAIEAVGGELRLLADDVLRADRVVSLPRLHGPRIDGIAQTRDGFIPVDEHCRVRGVSDVLAAGDVTSFPVKQGGIAAQQADAAAETIASGFGAAPSAAPFRPILRGLLLTGRDPQYLRHELAGGSGETSVATPEPLWWPPAKIVGRYLTPFLAELSGADTPEAPAAPGAVRVEVDIDPEVRRASATVVPEELLRAAAEDADDAVGAVMSRDLLLVAPEDTLGEVAEKMRTRDAGSAIVGDSGTVVGILTSRDLLRAFAGRAHPSEARVREWMTAEPVTVSTETRLDVAVTVMTEHGFHHLPVVEGGAPVGVVGLRQAARRLGTRLSVGLGF